jgi:hypothetical protein
VHSKLLNRLRKHLPSAISGTGVIPAVFEMSENILISDRHHDLFYCGVFIHLPARSVKITQTASQSFVISGTGPGTNQLAELRNPTHHLYQSAESDLAILL